MIANLDTPHIKLSPSSPSNYDWWVFSTALSDGWLMLYCQNTGKTGTVCDPSEEEWAKAFHAPSQPYQWADNSRVIVDDAE
jgi:hypothetical protein